MKKILIVDDEQAVRKLIMASLRKFDFQFVEAENGAQAVDLAVRWQPDLVIMDLSMPGSPVDGLQAIERIRARHRRCKILVVSGVFLDWNGSRAGGMGSDAFLAKPFSPLELRATVTTLLAPSGHSAIGEQPD